MKLKKKSLIFILLLLLVAVVGGTYAVFYNSIAIPNQFNIMLYDIKITDDFNNQWGDRNVSLTNVDKSNTDVVLRINYNEVWSKDIDGEKVFISNIANGSNVVNKEWADDFLNDFYLADDGWYYYKKVLGPNDSVQILKSVSLNEDLIKDLDNYSKYKNYDYDLSFNYEAISADSSIVKDAWDRIVNIEGGVVSEIN